MKCSRVLIAGVAVPLAAILLITAVATAYAFKLAFAIRGTPDQAEIARFAAQFGRSSWTILQVLLTLPLALWASRTFSARAPQSGMAVGVMAAAIQWIAIREFSIEILVGAVLMVGAGWLGGMAAFRLSQRNRPA